MNTYRYWHRPQLLFSYGLACVLLLAGDAWADVEFKFSGSLSADIRYRVMSSDERAPPAPEPTQWTLPKNGVSRNENRIRAALTAKLGEKVRAVADVEMVTFGFSDLTDIDSSTLRERTDPYYFEFHAAYVDINNIFGQYIPRFDLRIGRQTVPWGSADKFNPIANVNTLDLSDPLLFGRALANNMIRADWNPIGDLNFTAVLVPVFRPAQLPRSAPLALLDPLRPAPVADQDVRAALDARRVIYVPPSTGILTVTADTMQPEISGQNMQFGFRTAWKLLDQDMGISYYHGRFGIPVPALSISTGQLLNNLTKTFLAYPRMDVLGVEMAGSIQKLGGIGYWVEAAVYFPGEVSLALYDTIFDPTTPHPLDPMSLLPLPAGEPAPRPIVVEKTPFVKATLGVDYTIAGKVYLNLQYVHGFIDEFGAGRAARPRNNPTDLKEDPRVEARVGDYFVGGVDVKTLRERLLFRLFGVIKVPSVDLESRLFDDYSATGVLFPQIIWSVFDGTELMVGAFLMLGNRSSKFGDAAAGGSEVFARAKVSF